MLGQLAPCGGGSPIPLLKPQLLVGRQQSCDIPLSFPNVSSRHCELELREGFWFVRDLGSSNGTRVNGAVCTAQWLWPGDEVAFAKQRYNLTYKPPPGRPPPARLEIAGATPGTRLPPKSPAPTTPGPPTPRTTASAGNALGELVPCGGGNPISLRQPKLVIGRHADCDIVLANNAVSNRHCELTFNEGSWHVRDLGSRHGVRVDGVPCQEQRLTPGSVLWIAGGRFTITFPQKGPGAAPVARGPLFGQSLLQAAGLARWSPTVSKDDDEPTRRHTLDEPN